MDTQMIQLTNLSKSFGGQTLFTDVNLKLSHGQKIGLVGRNGSGKLLHRQTAETCLDPRREHAYARLRSSNWVPTWLTAHHELPLLLGHFEHSDVEVLGQRHLVLGLVVFLAQFVQR